VSALTAFQAILKNNLNRLMQQKLRMLMFLLFITAAISTAIYINTSNRPIGNVAVVSVATTPALDSSLVNITTLSTAPPLSELVRGRYDAVVIFESDGSYEILCIKNSEALTELLTALIENPSALPPVSASQRQPGTNIFGFTLMFVMMQGVTLSFLFAEDMEKKQLNRVAGSPVPFHIYASAMSIFTFAFLFAPFVALIAIACYALGQNVGLAMPQFVSLSALLCALATAFGLFITAFVKGSDSANMIGSAIAVLTSVLSGGFYSFEKGNAFLQKLVSALPQKAFLSLSASLEQGANFSTWNRYLLYIACVTIGLFVLAVAKTRKNYSA